MAQVLPFSDLIKAVNKEPERKTLDYRGTTYEFWSTPLTMGQREQVKAIQKKPDDANEFALRLLISKALKKDGKRMFQDGQYAELKHEWPVAEIEEAMMRLIETPDDSADGAEEGN